MYTFHTFYTSLYTLYTFYTFYTFLYTFFYTFLYFFLYFLYTFCILFTYFLYFFNIHFGKLFGYLDTFLDTATKPQFKNTLKTQFTLTNSYYFPTQFSEGKNHTYKISRLNFQRLKITRTKCIYFLGNFRCNKLPVAFLLLAGK